MIWYVAAVVLLAANAVFSWREVRANRERRARLDEHLTRSREQLARSVDLHRRMEATLAELDAVLAARREERDASLKSAARRLDAEWERDHGRPS